MKRKRLKFKNLFLLMVFLTLILTGNARAVTILETDPVSKEEGVGVDTSVTVTFGKDMDSGTIDENTFYVVTYPADPFAPAQDIKGIVSYDNKTATWKPTAENLEPDTEYFVTIVGSANGVKNQNGDTLSFDYKWKFNTGAEGTPPNIPAILKTNSDNGEKKVAVNANIAVTFVADMNPETINTDTFYVMTYSQDPLASGDRIPEEKVNVSYNEEDKTATWELAEDLKPDTDHFVTIAGGFNGIRDQNGNTLTFDYKWKFTTGTAPTVTETSPNDDSVPASTSLTITFSDDMEASTLKDSGAFTLHAEGSESNIEVKVSYADKIAIFIPKKTLDYETTYTATITTAAKGLNGVALKTERTWTFTTGTDIGAPMVVDTGPDDDESVPIYTSITANFSADMDESSITDASFTVNDGSGDISGTVTYRGESATFTPNAYLDYSTTYIARISSQAKNRDGTALEAERTWAFTTQADPGKLAMILTSPENDQKNVKVDAVIIAEFSENMDISTIDGSTFYITTGIGDSMETIPGTFVHSSLLPKGTKTMFMPETNLDYGETYAVTVTDVRDTTESTMEEPYSWSFTVRIKKGDVNGDGNEAELADLILALKVAAGIDSPEVHQSADVDGDDRIGMTEAIYILKRLAQTNT